MDFVGLDQHSGLYLAGDRASTSRHACHAVKLMVPLDGGRVVYESASRRELAAPVAIGADTPHALSGVGATLTVLIEPEQVGSDLLERLVRAEGPLVMGGREGAALRGLAREVAKAPQTAMPDVARESLVAARAGTPRRLDARVEATMRRIEAQPTATLDALASASGLSSFHLSRLFRREVGVPMRRWRLWWRLLEAFRAVIAGAPLADAAFRAGFSDQAHLSRTCRALVGRTPHDMLVRNSVQDLRRSAP